MPREGNYAVQVESCEYPDFSAHGSCCAYRVLGLLTYTKEYRNFNIYVKGARGKSLSISSIGTYTLTDKAYSEENIYYLVNDGIRGKGVSYDLSSSTGTSPVSITEKHIEFQLPLHGEPSVVFEGDKFTATRKGAFVEHLERVK